MQLLDAPESKKLFPPDVLKRAKEYLDACGSGGTGAYTHSQGVELCRQHVAAVRADCSSEVLLNICIICTVHSCLFPERYSN